MTAAPHTGLSAWQNGLLLALLTWLLTGLAYNRTFIETIPAGNFLAPYDQSPLMSLALRPLAQFPQRQVARVFFAICAASLLLAVGLLARSTGMFLDTAAPLGIMLILGFQFAPTILDFRRGQLDLPLLALLCAVYQLDKHDRPYRLAAAIAAAAMIHLWMLALLLYLLPRRRPDAFAFGLAIFAAAITLVAAASTWRNPSLLKPVILGFLQPRITGFGDGQSILGLTRAYFLNNAVVLYGTTAAGFCALLLGLHSATRHIFLPGSIRARLLISLTAISLLLTLPAGRRAYFVLLLPGLWTLLTGSFTPLVRIAAIIVYALLATTWSMSLAPFMCLFAAAALWAVLLLAISQTDPEIALSL